MVEGSADRHLQSGGEPVNPYDLTDAIKLLSVARSKALGTSDFAWDRIFHAGQYLEKQLAAYFADEQMAVTNTAIEQQWSAVDKMPGPAGIPYGTEAA